MINCHANQYEDDRLCRYSPITSVVFCHSPINTFRPHTVYRRYFSDLLFPLASFLFFPSIFLFFLVVSGWSRAERSQPGSLLRRRVLFIYLFSYFGFTWLYRRTQKDRACLLAGFFRFTVAATQIVSLYSFPTPLRPYMEVKATFISHPLCMFADGTADVEKYCC